MDSNNSFAGLQNGSNASTGSATAKPVGSRVFTVDTALPYSPFSSVVPFNSDIIPLPSVGLRSSQSLFSNPAAREEGRQELESLNSAIANQPTSQRLQATLHDLKELLRPENLSRFDFKTAPAPNLTPDSPYQALPRLTLSPFAQALYNATSVRYTSLNQVKPASNSNMARPKAQVHAQPVQRSQQHNTSHNQRAHDSNSGIFEEAHITKPSAVTDYKILAKQQPLPKPKAKFAVVIPVSSSGAPRSSTPILPSKLHTPIQPQSLTPIPLPRQPLNISASASRTPTKPSAQFTPTSNLAVMIPDLPLTFRAEDYIVAASPESPGTPQSVSRKSNRDNGYEENLAVTADQRQKAAVAIRNFEEYLQDIFDAEDQYDRESGLNNYFLRTAEGYSLKADPQMRIESLCQKVIDTGRFTEIPLDDLLRLQKLSEGAVRDLESVDLKVDENASESDMENLFGNIQAAELGLRSARTVLRLMAGGREDKQLYSEDAIQSVLNALTNVMDRCIIPIVEMRASGPAASVFKVLLAQKKNIANVLAQCRRLLTLLANLTANIELSETVINTLEFLASRLVFVENAHVEKDSILGIAKFDALRVVAMDLLAQIFLNVPQQRQGILSEILTSLEKLPVSKQSARQFKLAEGGCIQLVSALIMRLVQTSAGKIDDIKEKRRQKASEILNGDVDVDEKQSNGNTQSNGQHPNDTEGRAVQQVSRAIQELSASVSPLLDCARNNANYVVQFIVSRAMKSTKSGDAPYRNLLDLFVDDFITCLDSTDWPAAELLLRLLLINMVKLAEGDKTPTPAKNMALDLLGSMGAAISKLTAQVRKSAAAIEIHEGRLAQSLSLFAEQTLDKKASPHDLVDWLGPFRTSLEYMEDRCLSETQLRSAVGFLVATWAHKAGASYDLINDDDDDAVETEQDYGKLAYRLRMIINDKRWLSTEYTYDSVTASHARLAYSLTILHLPFCESFPRVLMILLQSMSSEQATVRSKSLKSVNQVLDTDPSILDRDQNIKNLILRCCSDPSIQVRDSALGLVGKCLSLRPALKAEMTNSILERVSDSGVGVRKRAIKLLKDIYLNSADKVARSAIADAILQRVTDFDEGVQELARTTIEEVWMGPFYTVTTNDNESAQAQLAIKDHVALIIETAKRPGASNVLDKVISTMLSSSSKDAEKNQQVCKALVANMFETIIDDPSKEFDNAPTARDVLEVLTIFARSSPKLFTAHQIRLLQPHLRHVTGGEETAKFRSVLVIFRHVLPSLSRDYHEFLADVRKDLLPATQRSPKPILDDLMACLWIICKTLEDYTNLTKVVSSCLTQLRQIKPYDLKDPSNAAQVKKLIKLSLITGMSGKHCDLDAQREHFKRAFGMKGESVSKLMVDTLCPFASQEQPLEVKKAALDAIGMICQSWPKNFSAIEVYKVLECVFEDDDAVLQPIVMMAFRDYLVIEEKRSEAGDDEGTVGTAYDSAAKLGVMGGSQGDGVAIGIAQRFLTHIVRLALSSADKDAFTATEVLTSIARQGLTHPKENAIPLITLEVSRNPKIAELAFREHKALHQKHETILEKEYLRAVTSAYEYQKRVYDDRHGASVNPFTSKLSMMMEVMKISKVKNRKKMYETLCSRMEFDPNKLDSIEVFAEHLEFSQFIIENLAFFEYPTVDDVMAVTASIEKVVTGLGTEIAHAIESEVFHVSLAQPVQVDEGGLPQSNVQPRDLARFQILTAASIMLSNLWETRTYLRRQYGLTIKAQQSKSKGVAKDVSKAPMRAPGVTGDKYWLDAQARRSVNTIELMEQQCRSFLELISIDSEFKLTAEGMDDEDSAMLDAPSDEEGQVPSTPSKGTKRKSPGLTPGGRKKRARSSSVGRGRARPKSAGKRGSVEADGGEGGWE